MTINIGYWAIPLAITIVSALWAILWPDDGPHGDYSFGAAFVLLFRLFAAIIVTLVAWLIWALVQ